MWSGLSECVDRLKKWQELQVAKAEMSKKVTRKKLDSHRVRLDSTDMLTNLRHNTIDQYKGDSSHLLQIKYSLVIQCRASSGVCGSSENGERGA
ncbi:hypothetical protein ANCDUO_23138 [Ancylostoma duodenale]|uniref:Uncharacterized protein n=1 Tax=Ancylostoma duodenale TaxID=51022 RepID=A0A0C2FE40_9BILA|nr:hypothetical protein ANCDUO_23138 [Ancylostoma duodenale]